MLRAVAPLLGPKTRLIIAGDGPLLPPLKELAAQLQITAHAHLLGVRRDVPAILNALDVFAMSSDTEGLPLGVLEAMATALPVVSTRVGGIPNVIEENRTGFLTPAGDEVALRDALAKIAAVPATARAFGHRARSDAMEKYSAERMGREYLDLYARVLSGKA
jgi:glycosyltransferase involved in cell wall biosynthesis